MHDPDLKNTLLTHSAIAASAGSGKTFRLAHRYIGLLLLGAPAERICALTFSRKAAGEIFDAIVGYLCDAALDAQAAARTAGFAGFADCDAADGAVPGTHDFAAALEMFLERLHRLRIGTLDSFLAAIVRAFPMELGIEPDFQLMDEGGADARSARLRLLGRLLEPNRIGRDPRQAFLDAFKQATFGQEEKQLVERLDTFVGDGMQHYRTLPRSEAWGRPRSIWGGKLPYARLDTEVIDALRARCPEISSLGIPALDEAYEAALAAEDRAPWPTALAGKRGFAILLSMAMCDCPPAEVTYGRRAVKIDPPIADVLRAAAGHLLHVELRRRVQRTAGLHAVLGMYERLYDAEVRRRGMLTFDDLAGLIGSDASPRPSRQRNAVDRLFIDYRLDGALDHWLLDEFQDTSDRQWAALENLADEIIQDDGGTRSFFYVGDVKQSIYAWRGGNYRLFGRILERYGSRIRPETLAESQRSVPAVVGTLNRVFGTLDEDAGLPSAAVHAWQSIWTPHGSAERLRGCAGYAALLEVGQGEDDIPVFEKMVLAIAEMLREQRLVERGFEVAVLVRTNEQGRNCVDTLRRACPGLDVVHEGSSAILDAPVVTLLLSLLRAAAHPADSWSWAHVCMSPLHAWVADATARERCAREVLEGLQEQGVFAVLRTWAQRLEERDALDAFGRLRLRQLLGEAERFDVTGNRSLDDFARHIEAMSVQASAAERAVRVMTVHQSKGLGFDVVFVPFPTGRCSLSSPRIPPLLGGQETGWLLSTPPKEVMESDAVLSQEVERLRAEACFSGLCVMYVALSRARRSLVMLTPPAPKSSAAVYEATLLRRTLSDDEGCPATEGVCEGERSKAAAHDDGGIRPLYAAGDRDWYRERTVMVSAARAPTESESFPVVVGAPRTRRREPSKEPAAEYSAARLFERATGDVLRFGSAIHRLFESIAWIEDFNVDVALADWRANADEAPDIRRDVEEQFRRCVAAPEIRALMARPASPVALWREAAFEVVVAGEILAGQFDRVVLHRDASGAFRSAEIVDFKSARLDDPSRMRVVAERYRPQMEDYARALRRMCNIPPSAIRHRIVFTRLACVWTLETQNPVLCSAPDAARSEAKLNP